ncbi:alpha-1,2-fucosyltransferase [Hymenobacter volaticus]|uniref:Alpha-1,2-fucosyltransferase n=1 Tax=Hymenobacter volaticus TaxID=2932254 RepID=A0ABY4G8U4_9BACT|nr:alpha-1,2-fucosyltransferase [Hymenobacter volaticus]UOQ67211.1 alpha-1,2-fucosyltransferase [Hymenobacter volaticus]
MVAVCLNGRLGNQLFQYAFAVSLSRKYKTFYVIDDSCAFDSVRKYFFAISITDGKYLRKIFKRIFAKQLKVIRQTGFEDADKVPVFLDNAYYDGYFQSIQYIENIKYELSNIFRIKPEFEKLFLDKYSFIFENINEKVVVLHYRIGDYAVWGNELLGGTNLVLPEVYYENALKLIPNINSCKVVLVTDDAKAVQDKLSFIQNKIIVSDQEIIDFQILMHADKLIISNSTFAWWAAALNQKKTQVFAPEFWIGFKVKKEYPIGIISSNFVKVSF